MARTIIVPKIKVQVSFDKRVKASSLYKVENVLDMHRLCMSIFNKDTFNWTEEMLMFCLNRNGYVVGYYKLSSGATSQTFCDSKVVFTIALNCTAHSIIFVHNHPSRNPNPSKTDIDSFNKLRRAGKLLDIHVLDSLVITNKTIFSISKNSKLEL